MVQSDKTKQTNKQKMTFQDLNVRVRLRSSKWVKNLGQRGWPLFCLLHFLFTWLWVLFKLSLILFVHGDHIFFLLPNAIGALSCECVCVCSESDKSPPQVHIQAPLPTRVFVFCLILKIHRIHCEPNWNHIYECYPIKKQTNWHQVQWPNLTSSKSHAQPLFRM